ncbi:hypothetical protein [Thermorudis peleae]|uniref:hypothetical protein n=1 Tax=Thermorudis peleae TaxID=1382356 RepID=UPI0005709344|nr:hypothetical protein [Thermorudis peleae]
MESHQVWAQAMYTEAETTTADPVLDHRLDLTRVRRFVLASGLILVLALGIRLIGFGNYPLSPHEAQLAYDARSLLRGESVSASGLSQPLTTLVTSLSFFLFGEGDGTARLVALVAGLIALAGLLAAVRRHDPAVALAAGVLAAISPVWTALSTRLDGGSLLLALTFCLVAISQNPGPATSWRAGVLGALAGLLPLTHPLGWLVLLALVLWGALRRTLTPPTMAVSFGSAILSLILGASFFFTHPAALGIFLGQSMHMLWNATLAHPFAHWQLPIFLLFTDAFPMFVFALIGIVWSIRDQTRTHWPLFRIAALWTALTTLLALVSGEQSLVLFGLLVTPLTVLGGIGLARLVAATPWRALRQGTDLALFGAILLLFLAAVSLLGRLIDGPGNEGISWWLNVLSLALLTLAILLGVATLWRSATARWAALTFIVLFLLLGLDVRTSTMLQATNTVRSGELLLADMPSPGLRSLANRIRQLSEDTTTFQADSQDPTGGHGLRIGIDPALAQPFRWYFRDFPHVVVQAGLTPTTRPDLDVLISTENLPPSSTFVVRSFPFSLELAPAYATPNWKTLLTSAISPRGLKHYFGFLIERRVATPAAPTTFALGLKPDLAQRLYGTTTSTTPTQ